MDRSSLRANGVCLAALMLGLTAIGCGGDDHDASPAVPQSSEHIAIAGTWTNSDFGSVVTYVIDDTSWSSSGEDGDGTAFSVVEYANADRHAVLQTPDDYIYFPGTFQRVLWTAPADGAFYYCTATYGCQTPELTLTGDDTTSDGSCPAPVVDETDLDGKGCAGFAWTKLTAP